MSAKKLNAIVGEYNKFHKDISDKKAKVKKPKPPVDPDASPEDAAEGMVKSKVPKAKEV